MVPLVQNAMPMHTENSKAIHSVFVVRVIMMSVLMYVMHAITAVVNAQENKSASV